MRTNPRVSILIARAMAALLAGALDVRANTITLTSTADSGPGTLRAALAVAADGDTLDATDISGTIRLTSGELLVNRSVAILGPGPAHLAVDGNAAGRGFYIASNTVVSLSGLTITNGLAYTNPAVPFPVSYYRADYGGGIYNDHATLTVSNCVVSGNRATNGWGGGIYNDHAALIVVGSVVSDNFAGADEYFSGATIQGGGICNDSQYQGAASLEVINSTLEGNTCAVAGGGIASDGSFGGNAALRVINCTLGGNSATWGAGIYLGGDLGGASGEIVGSAILTNSASAGGGLYSGTSGRGGQVKLSVVNSTLSGNRAVGGGGIYNASAELSVSNCLLSGNAAVGQPGYGGDGGAIWTLYSSTVEVLNSTLWDNSANANGGAISSYTDGRTNNASLRIVGCVLSGNTADGSGGGLSSDTSGLSITTSVAVVNCTLSGNRAATNGGAILNYSEAAYQVGGNLEVLGSTLSSNSAFGGGGIFNCGYGGTASIHNSTLSGNSASLGGAVYNSIGYVQLLNSTLSGNLAPYAWGIYNDYQYQADGVGYTGNPVVELGSTILSGSTTSFWSSSLVLGQVISHGCNLSSDDGGGFLSQPTDLVNTDPRLGPLQDNGGPTFTHALLCGSPAIDQGKNFSSLTADQRGLPRTVDQPGIPNASGGDGTDIGAFEVQRGTTPPRITCPTNITVEFADIRGAAVTFAPTASDDCSSPPVVVVCVPPPGSVFPIGTTTVHCTATDASGNSAACSFTVTVLGARGVKGDVLAELRELRASHPNRTHQHRYVLDEAIDALADSLNVRYWVDETHLTRLGGPRAMEEERDSVDELGELMRSRISPAPAGALQGFVDRIVKSDRLLAVVAIQQAATGGVEAERIHHAQADVAKGDAKAGTGKPVEAIEDYREAWRQVQPLP